MIHIKKKKNLKKAYSRGIGWTYKLVCDIFLHHVLCFPSLFCVINLSL